MTHLAYYEAPDGVVLDGLVDPIDLPRTIRVIARPNAKSIHSLAIDLGRSLGATRDTYTKAHGTYTLLSGATAWALARGVTDVYIGEIQDMDRGAILESLDFAQSLGAALHLIAAHGEMRVHAATLEALGGTHRRFSTLPEQIRTPSGPGTDNGSEGAVFGDDEPEPPDDEWVSFRAAYHQTFPPEVVSACDRVYLDAYAIARASSATTEEDVARLIADLWQRHGSTHLPATVAVRAVQAALFRNRLHVRVNLGHLERAVKLRLLNPLTDRHYAALASYADPWRAAATVLHAHHVSSEQSVRLRALDVQPDGSIPMLGITIEPAARVVIAAQRWRQLLTSDIEDPPLLPKTISALRAGIRRVTGELDLPLATTWRGTQKADRWQHNYGLKVTPIA
jgi:hypothetical protein